ncbi:MAG TPA: HD-GYP domain-containing protein, partial [Gaiellaceae bacterium]|nr:HD-GYP domain-containing protein [Gaiellaceae bacterium]
MVAAHPEARRWSAHPWAARTVRALAFGLPLLASIAFVQALTSFTGVPTSSLWVFLAWWFGVSLVASGVVTALYAVTRRLLPLGGLLGLSLVFPDRAPSRFRIALAAGTVESLQTRLQQMRERDEELDAQEAAEILLQLVAALDVHDRITRGHAERVRGYAAGLGRELGLNDDDVDRLNWSALLHDVGKLEVASEILNKAGRPTDEEWETLRRHPLEGELLVEPLRDWLGDWIDAVGYHHENWDGSGYPRGAAGEAIPLAGRIVAIADVYDVITSARSYKQAATPAEARAELVRCAGTQFEPRLVRAFVNLSLGRMRLVSGPLTWLSNAPLLVRLPLTPSLGATIGGVAALATAATASPAVARQPEFVRPVEVRHAAPVTTAFVPHDPVPAAVTPPAIRGRVRRASAHTHPGSTHLAPTAVTKPTRMPQPPVRAPKPASPPATTTPASQP